MSSFQDALWRRRQNENFDIIEDENNNRIKEIANAMKRISNLILNKSDWPEIVDARLRYDGNLFPVLYDHLADTDRKLDSVLDKGFDYSTTNPVFHTIMQMDKGTIIQSPVIDIETGEIYASQTATGYSDASESFIICRLNQAGMFLDSMTLVHGGHGTVFGIERDAGKVYIWTNYDIVDGSGNQIGNDLVRIPYTPNAVLTEQSSSIQRYSKFTNAYVLPAVDQVNGLIAFRIKRDGDNSTVQLRKLSDVKSGIDKVLGTVVIPDDLFYLQGMTIDDYDLYWRTGDVNNANYPDEITLFSFKDGYLKKRISCNFGNNAYGQFEDNFREPEGIFLYQDRKTGKKSLFASVVTGDIGRRINKLYAYHQSSNMDKFTNSLIEGIQKNETGAISQALSPPVGATLLSQLDKPNAVYYLSTSQSTQFTDHPESGDAGWFVYNGPHEPGRSFVQTLKRLSTGRPIKIYERIANKTGDNGDFKLIPTGAELLWKNVTLKNGATNADSDDRLMYAVVGNSLKIRGRVTIPPADGIIFAQLPSRISPSKNAYDQCVVNGTTGSRKISVTVDGELIAFGIIANNPENIDFVFVNLDVTLG